MTVPARPHRAVRVLVAAALFPEAPASGREARTADAATDTVAYMARAPVRSAEETAAEGDHATTPTAGCRGRRAPKPTRAATCRTEARRARAEPGHPHTTNDAPRARADPRRAAPLRIPPCAK